LTTSIPLQRSIEQFNILTFIKNLDYPLQLYILLYFLTTTLKIKSYW